jgi:GDP-L-fucose synthase
MSFDLKGKRILVAGHRGMVGGALVRRLGREPCDILLAERSDMDLLRQDQVERWMQQHRPDAVIVAAAKVGGIHANATYPAQFIYENMMIEANLIHSAHQTGVQKLLFLGSSCIYPRLATQPISEDALLTGPLEPTNEWYAVAKIAGIKLCQAYRRQYGCDFISAMPTNLYGEGDNFHPQNSHVPAALLQRFHQAKQDGLASVTVWGSGTPKREFLNVDDLADACIFLLGHYSGEAHVNVGTGEDISIAEFAGLIRQAVGYPGEIIFDTSKPDGTPRKVMDVSRLTAMGWQASIPLAQGLRSYYDWYLNNLSALRQA